MKNGTVLLLVVLGLIVGVLIGRLSLGNQEPPGTRIEQEPLRVLNPTLEHDLCLTQIDGHVRIERCSKTVEVNQPIFL